MLRILLVVLALSKTLANQVDIAFHQRCAFYRGAGSRERTNVDLDKCPNRAGTVEMWYAFEAKIDGLPTK
jgi:hypothetical protein